LFTAIARFGHLVFCFFFTRTAARGRAWRSVRGVVCCCLKGVRWFVASRLRCSFGIPVGMYLLLCSTHDGYLGTCNHYITCSLGSRGLHGLVFLPVVASRTPAILFASRYRIVIGDQGSKYTVHFYSRALPRRTIKRTSIKWRGSGLRLLPDGPDAEPDSKHLRIACRVLCTVRTRPRQTSSVH
jgi:hypothetical protein